MPAVAVCPEHGPFESRLIVASDSQNVTLSNNAEPCPTCQAGSQVMEGTFNFDVDGLVHVLAAPAWSRFALKVVQTEVRELADAAQDRSLSEADVERIADRVVERIAERDQGFADLLVTQIKGRPRSAVVAFLLGLLAVLGMMDGAIGGARLTYDLIARIVHEVFGG